jgi:hypothetical protein
VKVSVSRIAPVMECLTHPYQFTFLKGRYLNDVVLALHEIIHLVKNRPRKGVFLKLDFHNMYDRLDRHFMPGASTAMDHLDHAVCHEW